MPQLKLENIRGYTPSDISQFSNLTSTKINLNVRIKFPLEMTRRMRLTIKASEVDDHLLYLHDRYESFRTVTVSRIETHAGHFLRFKGLKKVSIVEV